MPATEPETAGHAGAPGVQAVAGQAGSWPAASRADRPGFSSPLLLRQLLPGLLLLGLAVRLVVPVGDPDAFWHLRAGDELRRGLELPRT